MSAAIVETLYTEVPGTNCIVGGRHGVVTEVVRELGLRHDPIAAFVHLDSGQMLHVQLGKSTGDRDQWHEVRTFREIDREEFDRLTEIDTLRRDMGWRD